MILRCIQVIDMKAPPQDVPNIGTVPIVGDTITVARGWFQCDRCGIMGAFEPLVSPMTPPPCPQGCDDPERVT